LRPWGLRGRSTMPFGAGMSVLGTEAMGRY
jgi:hypothetical protein